MEEKLMRNRNWMTLWNEAEYQPLAALRRDMEQLFDDFWSSPVATSQLRGDAGVMPPCEVEEEGDHYLLSVEMTGVAKDDVKIEVIDGQITIQGERRKEKERREGAAWYSERRFGRYQRSFRLPPGVNAEKIEAHLEDGVLRLMVPKAESAKPRQIKVTAGSGQGFLGKLLNQSRSQPKSLTVGSDSSDPATKVERSA
jgi:HSP20 family protein